MEKLISDSKVLTKINDDLDSGDSVKEFLDSLVSNTFLLMKLYSGDYDFKLHELLTLVNQLNMLECSKLDEILVLIHFFDREKIKKKENISGDITFCYLKIKIKETSSNEEFNLFDTLISNDMVDLLKWIYNINWINEEEVFEKAIEYDSTEIYKWLVPQMNLSNDVIITKCINNDSINIFKILVPIEIVGKTLKEFYKIILENRSHKILIYLFRSIDKTQENIFKIFNFLAIKTGNLELMKILYNEFNVIDTDLFYHCFFKIVEFEIDIFEWFINISIPSLEDLNKYMDRCMRSGYFEFSRSLFEYKNKIFGEDVEFDDQDNFFEMSLKSKNKNLYSWVYTTFQPDYIECMHVLINLLNELDFETIDLLCSCADVIILRSIYETLDENSKSIIINRDIDIIDDDWNV